MSQPSALTCIYSKKAVSKPSSIAYPYRPQSELESHKTSLEAEFRVRPSASLKEAGDRIFKLTGIRRSKSRVEAFLKRTGMKYRKTGGIPAKAEIAKQEEFLKKS
jgi:transposase